MRKLKQNFTIEKIIFILNIFVLTCELVICPNIIFEAFPITKTEQEQVNSISIENKNEQQKINVQGAAKNQPKHPNDQGIFGMISFAFGTIGITLLYIYRE